MEYIIIKDVTAVKSLTANQWTWMSVPSTTVPTGYKKILQFVNSIAGSTDTSQIICGVGTSGARCLSWITQTVTMHVTWVFIKIKE